MLPNINNTFQDYFMVKIFKKLFDMYLDLTSYFCHQMEDRSIVSENQQSISCFRCSSIYFGFLSSLILFLTCDYFLALTVNSIYIPLLILPIAIDGGTQELNMRLSNNKLRLLTGFLAGVGISLIFLTFFNIVNFGGNYRFLLCSLVLVPIFFYFKFNVNKPTDNFVRLVDFINIASFGLILVLTTLAIVSFIVPFFLI